MQGCAPDGCAPAADAVEAKRQAKWTEKAKELFLDHLAASCCVARSAEAVGMPRFSVYNLRRRDPAFAEACREAVLIGYESLELRLIRHALTGGGSQEVGGGPDGQETIHVETALRLLTVHRNALRGKPSKGGPAPRMATREETTAAILKKLEVVERRFRDKGLLPPLLPASAASEQTVLPPEGA